jgi:hypothetical protein
MVVTEVGARAEVMVKQLVMHLALTEVEKLVAW